MPRARQLGEIGRRQSIDTSSSTVGDSISTRAMEGVGYLLGLSKQQAPAKGVRDQSAKWQLRSAKQLQRAVRRWLRSNREPAAERAVLRISISSALGLRNKEFLGTSDPYCKFTLSGRYTNVVRRTRLCQSTLSPTWDEDFCLLIRLERQIELRIEVCAMRYSSDTPDPTKTPAHLE